MDRIDAMAAFVAVADLHGFAPAARRLGLSPSAVTRLVAALEEHLDTRLLQRTTRSVSLTDGGQRYLDRARRILGEVTEAEGLARAGRTNPSGRLVVTAPGSFGQMHVAPLMTRYLAIYPAVTGNLMLGDRILNLIDESVDVAIRIGKLDDASYVARAVGVTKPVVVASPAYLAAHKRPRTIDDLARHDLIQFTAIAPNPEWRLMHDGRERRISFVPRFVTNSADVAIGQAERGGGLALVLSYQVADAVREGRLEMVLRSAEPPPLPIHVVYPTTRQLSANVRAFIELIKSTCDWKF